MGPGPVARGISPGTRSFTWRWFEEIWATPVLMRAIINSAMLGAASATVATVLALLLALGFRPFYLLAGLYAALGVPLWAAPDSKLGAKRVLPRASRSSTSSSSSRSYRPRDLDSSSDP